MDIIGQINQLHNTLKFLLANLILTAPFFYIDLYFLANSTFIGASLYIPIVASYCISTVWFFSCFLIFAAYNAHIKPNPKEHGYNALQTSTINSILSTIIISIICIYNHYTLKTLFIIAALTSISLFFISFFVGIRKTADKK